MTYKAIICNQDRFDVLNKKALIYTKKQHNTKADYWCKPLVHPTDNRIAFTVKERILPILKGEKIIELTNDWFPDDNI